ncbi:hypothetical protein MNBD_GAMMA09-1526 [hydrothermal vent metagenome]|uniref:Thioredoxin domain-containing protein n=1 Tax=hydrothermal vent metagenome TaxID=652676 RepID=A0A3B0X8R3_9ZZZZ
MSMLSQMRDVYKQSRILRIFLQGLLLLAVYLSIRAWQGRDDIQGLAPVIQGVQLNGEAYDLMQYRGEPVLIHFWATWCPICQQESSNIDALAKDHNVITVATWIESIDEVETYMREEKLTMPVIVDGDRRLAKKYAIKAVPYSFIIDGKGAIQFIEKGYSTEFGLRLRLWWAGFD